MQIKSRSKRPFQLTATVGVLALVALAVPALSSANGKKVEGVRADLKQGTLQVKGGDGGQQVAISLKAGDASRIQVDAGNDGSADFSFDRGDVRVIKVKMG